VSAFVHERCIDNCAASLQPFQPSNSTTAIKAAIHGQELPGLTFHNSSFGQGALKSFIGLRRFRGSCRH